MLEPARRPRVDDGGQAGRAAGLGAPHVDPETGELTQQERVSVETTIPSNVQSPQDAEREATAKYRLATQRAVKLSLTIRGAPALLAKSVINVDGLGKRLSGKYYVKTAEHTLSGSQGYTTKLTTITDGYQRGYGSSSGGSGNPDALIQSCISDLQDARNALLGFSAAEVQAASQLDRLVRAVTNLSGQTGSSRASGARRLADQVARLASSARSQQLSGVAGAAQSCAAQLRRIGELEDARAEGNVNEKGESDQFELQARGIVDPETGVSVTIYVPKRGRDA